MLKKFCILILLIVSCGSIKAMETPLHIAAGRGDLVQVKALLRNPNTNVNAQDQNGMTPLYWATTLCRTSVTHELLQRNDIDVNLPDNNGITPLHKAATNNDTHEIVRELLQTKGIDVNACDINGETPLRYALAYNNIEFAHALLQMPTIRVNALDRIGMSILAWAIVFRNEAFVRELLQVPGIDVTISQKGKILNIKGIEVIAGQRIAQMIKDHTASRG